MIKSQPGRGAERTTNAPVTSPWFRAHVRHAISRDLCYPCGLLLLIAPRPCKGTELAFLAYVTATARSLPPTTFQFLANAASFGNNFCLFEDPNFWSTIR